MLSSFHAKHDRVLHIYSNQWDKSWRGVMACASRTTAPLKA
ncbi:MULTISPECIES: hypothetical protein [unclassified Pseudomonas]